MTWGGRTNLGVEGDAMFEGVVVVERNSRVATIVRHQIVLTLRRHVNWWRHVLMKTLLVSMTSRNGGSRLTYAPRNSSDTEVKRSRKNQFDKIRKVRQAFNVVFLTGKSINCLFRQDIVQTITIKWLWYLFVSENKKLIDADDMFYLRWKQTVTCLNFEVG